MFSYAIYHTRHVFQVWLRTEENLNVSCARRRDLSATRGSNASFAPTTNLQLNGTRMRKTQLLNQESNVVRRNVSGFTSMGESGKIALDQYALSEIGFTGFT